LGFLTKKDLPTPSTILADPSMGMPPSELYGYDGYNRDTDGWAFK
jgi:hypothetical protein